MFFYVLNRDTDETITIPIILECFFGNNVTHATRNRYELSVLTEHETGAKTFLQGVL
jgi:hypothetical protein